jgi:NADP-dependent 3-hydroxy acid dehydrogenase YdfG
MSKIVFITGATSGFGKECARIFASNQYKIVITGRRKERLEELKNEIETTYKVEVLSLCFDVQNKNEVFNTINQMPESWKAIDILINNAGLSLGRDGFDTAEIEDWEIMMQTNVNGLLYVSRALLPHFIATKNGHIINVGSIAGKEVYENGNVYCASKFAVDAISKSMRIDLLKYGIKVTAIHPGAADTEFSMVRFKGDEEKANGIYKGLKPLSAKDVADAIYYTATLPEHVCINELVITCKQQANTYYYHRI